MGNLDGEISVVQPSSPTTTDNLSPSRENHIHNGWAGSHRSSSAKPGGTSLKKQGTSSYESLQASHVNQPIIPLQLKHAAIVALPLKNRISIENTTSPLRPAQELTLSANPLHPTVGHSGTSVVAASVESRFGDFGDITVDQSSEATFGVLPTWTTLRVSRDSSDFEDAWPSDFAQPAIKDVTLNDVHVVTNATKPESGETASYHMPSKPVIVIQKIGLGEKRMAGSLTPMTTLRNVHTLVDPEGEVFNESQSQPTYQPYDPERPRPKKRIFDGIVIPMVKRKATDSIAQGHTTPNSSSSQNDLAAALTQAFSQNTISDDDLLPRISHPFISHTERVTRALPRTRSISVSIDPVELDELLETKRAGVHIPADGPQVRTWQEQEQRRKLNVRFLWGEKIYGTSHDNERSTLGDSNSVQCDKSDPSLATKFGRLLIDYFGLGDPSRGSGKKPQKLRGHEEESEASAPPSQLANSIAASVAANSRSVSLAPEDDIVKKPFATVNGEDGRGRKRSRDPEGDNAIITRKKPRIEQVDEAKVGAWIASVQRVVKGKAVLSRETLAELSNVLEEIEEFKAEVSSEMLTVSRLGESLTRLSQLPQDVIPFEDEYGFRRRAALVVAFWRDVLGFGAEGIDQFEEMLV